MEFEVREIDAWNCEDGWTWNASFFMGTFYTKAKDEKRAFSAFLRKQGIIFKVNRTLIEDDGEVLTIIDRKTKEPLFCAIPVNA